GLTRRRHSRQSDGENDIGCMAGPGWGRYRRSACIRRRISQFLKPSLSTFSGRSLCLDQSAWMPKFNKIG
ncbi:hypothetical protein OAD47_02235, partial [Pseudomonadales bacterium]|nr:hypothetical protein [Pseudomonadales bacterium]